MAFELVTPLPPGAPSHTRLARHGARLVVLREIMDGTDCSWPEPSPNLVTLQEVGELQGKRHALFPWVPGVTLRELLKALELVGKPTPLGLLGRVLLDAARALAAITPARAHGGIQDGAMQIGFDGHVSVLDFGAPRVSRFRPIGRVNFAADVFSLGGVLHSALTGFQGDYARPPVTLPAPSTSHPEATPAIDDVVMRALSSQPDSRQAGAAAFADELEAVLGDDLYSEAQLAVVVNTLFRDRFKLLQSLGGLVEEQPDLEPPSEPTLPRIVVKEVERTSPALGDDRVERTDTRIPIPVEPPPPRPSRAMVPWDSGEAPPPAGDATSEGTHPGVVAPARPGAGPPLSGPRPAASPRPSPPAASADSDTNPRGSPGRDLEPDTNPRASAPTRRPADTDETSEPRSSPAKLPAHTDETSEPHGLLRPRASAPPPLGGEEEHAPTRPSGPRALSRGDLELPGPHAPLPDPDVPEDTNPRTLAPEATSPRAPLRARGSAARPPRAAEEPEDTGPRPQMPPPPRNTTEAERHRARGQERLRTPPEGVALGGGEDEAALNEPTAVRGRVADPQQTAQTAQRLPAAPGPASSGGGLPVVMVLLLLVVVGLAVGVVVKLKRQSERPPAPVDEPVAEVDAGPEGPLTIPDAGGLEAGLAPVPALDAGDDGDDGDDEAHAGPGPSVDAGRPEAGSPVKKKPVKKGVKKKRRR